MKITRSDVPPERETYGLTGLPSARKRLSEGKPAMTAMNGIYSTGDDLLAALYALRNDTAEVRRALLCDQSTRVLREALDLCGIDAAELGRGTLVNKILVNFYI